MSDPDLIDQALADMRAGRRVLVIAPSDTTRRDLRNRIAARLTESETVRRSGNCDRVTAPGDGWIEIRGYTSVRHGACLGIRLDRVYVDHSELSAELALRLAAPRSTDIVHI